MKINSHEFEYANRAVSGTDLSALKGLLGDGPYDALVSA